jgi:hypothetical protein
LLLISAGLLAVSLFIPLGTGLAAVCVLALCLVSIALIGTRRKLLQLAQNLNPRGVAVCAALLVLTAVVAGTTPADGGSDYALYHYPVTKWLSEIGTVPGLALIHMRFGTMASWWAVQALLDVPLGGRVAPILGYVALCLILIHAVLAAARVLQGRANVADRFFLVLLVLMGPYVFGYTRSNPFSDSADRGVALLVMTVAWYLVALSDALEPQSDGDRALDMGSVVALMVLAAGAVTLKWSALPTLATVVLFIIVRRPDKSLVIAAALTAIILVGKTVAYSLTVAGCPMYPAAVGCIGFPWAIDAADARAYSEVVTNWARWGTRTAQGTFVDWLASWVATHPLLSVSALISVAAGALGLGLTVSRRRGLPPLAWPVLLGVVGLVYGILLGPSFRFLVGYVSLVPAAALLLLARRSGPAVGDKLPKKYLRSYTAAFGVPALLMLGLVALPTTLFNLGALARGELDRVLYLESVHWLAPPPNRTASVVLRSTWDVEYWTPVGDGGCYGTPLPCTPYLTYPEIRLRSPERGIAGGFVRVVP